MDGLGEGSTVTWPNPKTFAGYISLLDLVSGSCFSSLSGGRRVWCQTHKSLLHSCVRTGVTSCAETDPGLRAPAHSAELSWPHLLA